jgi:simple sugar transport system ATP-binding protein
VLRATGLKKRFGSVEALRGVDFTANAGEVVALVGDNGAGKSTLIKILSGYIVPDEGEIFVDGELACISSSAEARSHGIETVYQDLALADELNPAANVFLGNEIRRRGPLGRFGFLDKKRMDTEIETLFASLAIKVKAGRQPVSRLSGG